MRKTQLDRFFKHRLYSGDLGVMKPNPKIFHQAMAVAKFEAEEIAYVGDSYEDDILSSQKVGWLTVHFNPAGEFGENGVADFEITDLAELTRIF